MKRTIAPAGVIVLGAAVALAMLGVAYGLWADTLRISGAVATGSVNAAFRLSEIDEGLVRGSTGGPKDNGVNEDLEAGGIDTAECYVRATSPVAASDAISPDASDELIASPPSDLLYVLLKNAYPSFNCYVDFAVLNAGSIPIKVTRPVVGPSITPDVLTVEFQNCYEAGAQIEPGKSADCTLHVHVERGARPNQVYRFGATICAYQWNAGNAVRCAIPVDVEPLPVDLDKVESVPVTTSPLP